MKYTKEKTAAERVCKNCKYYLEHYVIRGTKFYAIGGHCINDELYNPHKKNNYALHDNCGYWESNESVKSERKESIKRVIDSMGTHLFYIKSILEKDEE